MANTKATSLSALYDEAFQYIQDAKQYKKSNQLNLSHDLYLKGIETFMTVLKKERDVKKKQTLKKYVAEFMNEAETLQKEIKMKQSYDSSAPSAPSIDILDLPDPPSANIAIDLPDPPSMHGHGGDGDNDNDEDEDDIEKAQHCLNEAIELDQHKQYIDAVRRYKKASQLFLNGMSSNLSLSKQDKDKYREKVSTIIGRCELLNKLIQKQKEESSARINSGIANEALSKKEVRVLRNSSFIRNLELLPWIEADEHEIVVGNDDLYKDPHGLLPLSEKQKSKFSKWKRIRKISNSPSIVSLVTPYSITQTLISDCSFVSSLTVTALYEKLFNKKLITSIIYPQTSKLKPIYNPNGKYAVKLFINGCYRKIIIDDYLPISQHGKLLCSYSNNPNEFWVSLIEKAFLKVMGGYDFPGSTSCEDLHVLTGWIPERIGFRDHGDAKQNDGVDKVFDRLVSGYKFGDCLITLSSNKMSEEEADSLGLVPSHAYAALRVERLGNHKFMLIKNPWASKRWNGRFSANDDKSWTPQLRKALNYDPQQQRSFDNGIFWMCYEDVMKHFSAVFLNWNPELFSYRITQHGFWSKKIGPKNDSYNLGYNPQFTLDVDIANNHPSKPEEKEESSMEAGSVWILLSKHMENSKRQEQDKNDFLTLHVYDENTVNTRDRRIFHRKGALHTGTYINSPHYLMKIDVEQNQNVINQKQKVRRYTVIISQYEKKHDVSFTITAYSTLPARFKPIDDFQFWRYQKVFNGAWNKKYCGGSPNHDSFPLNPQFKITTFFKTHLRFLLEAPIEFSVNIQLYLCTNDKEDDEEDDNVEGDTSAAMSNYDDNNVNLDEDVVDIDDDQEKQRKGGKILSRTDYSKDLLIGDSGPYRYGVCMVDALNVAPGKYIAIISTFKPQQLGPFKFTVKSVENLQLKVV